MNTERALEIAKGMKVQAECRAEHTKGGHNPYHCGVCEKPCIFTKKILTGKEGIDYSNKIIKLLEAE